MVYRFRHATCNEYFEKWPFADTCKTIRKAGYAGIEIAPENLRVVGVMHRKSTEERIDFFLTATQWSGEITNREPTKCDQLAWFDLDRLPENVIPYVRRALESYRRGGWFDSFGWT